MEAFEEIKALIGERVTEDDFGRVFKKETGTTPGEYLMEVRLLQAQKLLRRHEIMMTEIAMRCGFNSSAHFTACFHKRFGITPSVYRSKYH